MPGMNGIMIPEALFEATVETNEEVADRNEKGDEWMEKFEKTGKGAQKKFDKVLNDFRETLLMNIQSLNSSVVKMNKIGKILNSFVYGSKSKAYKEYINSSKIWEKDFEELGGITFEKRFLSILYFFIMEYTEDILSSYSNDYLSFMNKLKKREKSLNKFMNVIMEFHNSMMMRSLNCRYSYYELLMYLNKDSEKRKKKMIRIMDEEIENLSHKNYNEDFEWINDLLKLSYVMSTESTDFKGTFKPVPNVSVNDKEVITIMIKSLGSDILKYQKKYSLPVLFSCWLESNPKIETSLDISNKSMRVGILGLMYMGYITNDRTISSMIRKLV